MPNKMSELQKDTNDAIDQLEIALVENGVPIDCPLTHKFIGGMYVREIYMPAGVDGVENIITSLVHNTHHPFFLMRGKVAVYSDNYGEQILEAPYCGQTSPNTRRVLRIIQDAVWITVHRTDIVPASESKEDIEAAVKSVVEEITLKHENKYAAGHFINNNFIAEKKEISEQY